MGECYLSDKPEKFGPVGPEDAERRAALIKIGKYAAYTQPIVLSTISGARGATPTISGTKKGPTRGDRSVRFYRSVGIYGSVRFYRSVGFYRSVRIYRSDGGHRANWS